MASEKTQLLRLRKQTEVYLERLEEVYPHKDISEYTRLVEQLRTFLAYGSWEPKEEDE